jgi:KDO2-lipid IV(A) lauroyltransferase
MQLLLRLIPRRWALAAGRGAGLLAWRLDRRHREVAIANIAASLPGASDPAVAKRISRGCFAHFGAVAVECLLMPYRNPADVERLADWEGRENLERAHGKGRGVLVTSGHLGNWEMVALLQGWAGLPMALVTRPLDNPLLEALLARGRRRSGNEIIHKRRAVRSVLRALRDGWTVALVIDQDFPQSDRIFVDFFGRPAAAAPTLALLALRTGAPIVPVVGLLGPRGRYRIRYLPPIEPPAEGNREAGVLDIMSRCTALLEETIRAHPEQWLWMHRRWKTRPRSRPGGAQEIRCPDQGVPPSSSTGTAP